MRRYAYISYLFALSCALIYLAGCDDNVIDNGDPSGCSKIPVLVRPASDTTFQASSVDFYWENPTCGAARYYKLVVYSSISNDTIVSPYNLASIILDQGHRYYWTVYSYYGTPVNDSTVSATYDFFLEQ